MPAAIVLTAPLWIDAPSIKARVVSWIDQATAGRITYERLELHYLPTLRVTLERPGFSRADLVEFVAKSASVELALVPLLTGRIRPSRLRVDAPRVRMQLPPSASDEEPLSRERIEQAMHAVVDTLVERLPGMVAEVVDGRVALQVARHAPVQFDDVNVRTAVSDVAVDARLACRSDLWRQLVVDARFTRKDLVGAGRAELTALRLSRLGEVLGTGRGWPVRSADVDATVSWEMRGLTGVQAEASISAPAVVLQSGAAETTLAGVALDVAAKLSDRTFALELTRLALATPKVEATGRLSWQQPGGFVLDAKARNADVPGLYALLRDLAPQIDRLAQGRARVESGTITSLTIASRSEDLRHLFEPSALRASGVVAGVAVSVPELDVRFRDVSATISLAQGELRVQRVAGAIGGSVVHSGALVTRLGADPMPIEADVTADVDLGEAASLARRLIRDRRILAQLARVERLDGRAVVHGSLAGDVDHLRPRVDVTDLQLSGRHAAIPFPVRVTRGAVGYAEDTVTVRDLGGAIGRSAFAGLGGRVSLKAPFAVSGGRATVVLSLDELLRWARSRPELARRLVRLEHLGGQLALEIAGVEGPASAPARLQFRIAATPRHVTADVPSVVPRLALDGGVITLSSRSIDARGVRVSMLDALLQVGGRIDDYPRGIQALTVTARGDLGEQALGWLQAKARVPDAWRLEEAVSLSGVEVDWRGGGTLATRGQVAIRGGPVVGFDVRRTPQRLDVLRATVHDETSDATFEGSLEDTRFAARFKGRLAGRSIERVFVRRPILLGHLQGDLDVAGDWTRPARAMATGALEGSRIRVPVGLPAPLVLERFALEGKDSMLRIVYASVASGESRVEVSGAVDRRSEKFVVDADIRGETVTIPVPAREKAPGDARIPDDAEDPGSPHAAGDVRAAIARIPVEGTIRVDLGRLRFGRLDIAPLVGSTSLKTGRLDLSIDRASLCAIALSGGVTASDGVLEAKLTLRARGAEMDASIACLTDQRLRMTGRADLDAAFEARGHLGTLRDGIQGRFTAVAHDGRIDRFDALAKVLNLLNVTEVVRGTLPDLQNKGMAYRTATVKGRISGRTIQFEEAVLDATGIKIAAEGNVDLARGTIDVNVLAAPLQTANWLVDKIPILRRILGGTVLAIPVRVGGTIAEPVVVPWGLRAVASRMTDIIANTLKLPADLVNVMSADPAAQPEAPTK